MMGCRLTGLVGIGKGAVAVDSADRHFFLYPIAKLTLRRRGPHHRHLDNSPYLLISFIQCSERVYPLKPSQSNPERRGVRILKEIGDVDESPGATAVRNMSASAFDPNLHIADSPFSG